MEEKYTWQQALGCDLEWLGITEEILDGMKNPNELLELILNQISIDNSIDGLILGAVHLLSFAELLIMSQNNEEDEDIKLAVRKAIASLCVMPDGTPVSEVI